MSLRRITALLSLLLVLPLAGCTTVLTLAIVPAAGVQKLTAIGQTAQYKAMSTSQTGSAATSSSDATNSVRWTVSDPGVATINSSGLATAVGFGITAITAEVGGVVASSDLTVTAPLTIQTLAIIPAAGIEKLTNLGQVAQYRAIQITQVGTAPASTTDVTSSSKWLSANSSIATINQSGLATAVGAGSTTITAETGSLVASSDLTVTPPATTQSLVVVPVASVVKLVSAGQTAQFRVLELTTLGTATPTSTDVTNLATWTAVSTSVATINPSGLATAVGVGNTLITAEYNGMIGSSDLTVTGSQTVASLAIIPGLGVQSVSNPGQTVQFKAIASTQVGAALPTGADVTNSVTWSTATSAVATIDASGLATSTGVGKTTVTAQQGGLLTSSDLTVTGSVTVQSLAIIPAKGVQVVGAVGQTAQFRAIASTQVGTAPATTLDVTNSATWIPADISIATIDASGLATATGFGTTAITAEYNGITSTPSDLTITLLPNVPATLVIIPAGNTAVTTNVGETTQFVAIGSLSGIGANQDLTDLVTWISSDTEVATINQAGLATDVGTNTQSGGSSNTTTITALATTSSGTVISATSTLTTPTGGTLNLTTLALYEVGAGTGVVTSSPAGIDCGPTASHATCTGTFPAGTSVTLTETPVTGSFASWSTNCASNMSTPNQCSILMGTVGTGGTVTGNNETVGAVFNTP